jgi:hypothetical protein
MPLSFCFNAVFIHWCRYEYIVYTLFCLEVVLYIVSWSWPETCLQWSWVAVIVLGLKSCSAISQIWISKKPSPAGVPLHLNTNETHSVSVQRSFRYLNPVPQGSVPLPWILPSAFQMIVLVGKPFGLLFLLTFMSSNLFLLLQSFLVLNKGRFLELISGAPIKFRLYCTLVSVQ